MIVCFLKIEDTTIVKNRCFLFFKNKKKLRYYCDNISFAAFTAFL